MRHWVSALSIFTPKLSRWAELHQNRANKHSDATAANEDEVLPLWAFDQFIITCLGIWVMKDLGRLGKRFAGLPTFFFFPKQFTVGVLYSIPSMSALFRLPCPPFPGSLCSQFFTFVSQLGSWCPPFPGSLCSQFLLLAPGWGRDPFWNLCVLNSLIFFTLVSQFMSLQWCLLGGICFLCLLCCRLQLLCVVSWAHSLTFKKDSRCNFLEEKQKLFGVYAGECNFLLPFFIPVVFRWFVATRNPGALWGNRERRCLIWPHQTSRSMAAAGMNGEGPGLISSPLSPGVWEFRCFLFGVKIC